VLTNLVEKYFKLESFSQKLYR